MGRGSITFFDDLAISISTAIGFSRERRCTLNVFQFRSWPLCTKLGYTMRLKLLIYWIPHRKALFTFKWLVNVAVEPPSALALVHLSTRCASTTGCGWLTYACDLCWTRHLSSSRALLLDWNWLKWSISASAILVQVLSELGVGCRSGIDLLHACYGWPVKAWGTGSGWRSPNLFLRRLINISTVNQI